MYKCRKNMTLIELVVGMFLAAILLSSLAYFYNHMQLLDREADKEQLKAFNIRYLGGRLSRIIPYTLAEHQLRKDFIFCTSSDAGGLLAQDQPSLLLIFDSNASLKPELANNALARLYVDKQKRLCLATWPSPKRWRPHLPTSAQIEVLLENVDKISFKFYVTPEQNREIIKSNVGFMPKTTKEPDTKGEWISYWSQEYGYLPPMIKIEVSWNPPGSSSDHTPIQFAFQLPHSQKLVVYK